MTRSTAETKGIALFCDAEGQIRQVLLDDFMLDIPEDNPGLFSSLFDAASRQKALSFLVDVKTNQITFNYQLDLQLRGEIKSLYFLGVYLKDKLLIVGADNHKEAVEFTNHLQQINNEQANQIRRLMKSSIKQLDEREQESEMLFEEVSRLNNELINLQRDLHKKNAQLEKLNELKNRFLGMAAHDLRNPLNIIISYADFIQMEAEGSLSQEHQEFLETIKNSSWSMLALINDLLDYSRIESGKLELDSEAGDLVVHMRKNVELNRVLAAKKQIHISFSCNVEEQVAEMDWNKLDQVLNNLTTNAVKFSKEGQNVGVELRIDGDQASISIRDQGMGIPENMQEYLFKPFEKGRAGTKGEKSTGLGMAIVKRIVEGHGGSITFESRVGEGTTFFIQLPLNKAADESVL